MRGSTWAALVVAGGVAGGSEARVFDAQPAALARVKITGTNNSRQADDSFLFMGCETAAETR